MGTDGGRVTGLVLAAGAGSRYGGPKALEVDADGTSWLARACVLLLDGGCDDVIAVLGAEAERAARLLPRDPRVRSVVAERWAAGMGESLVAGLRAARETGAVAVCTTLVDLPDLEVRVVRRVLRRPIAPSTLRRAVWADRPGHPVLIGADHLDEVMRRTDGDHGARDALADLDVERVPCADLPGGDDVDGRRGAVRLVSPTAADGPRVRAMRLEMLADSPLAFHETVASAERLPESAWRERAARGDREHACAFAAQEIETGRWVGVMSGYVPPRGSRELGPMLVGVYVSPAWRGRSRGVTDLLLDAVTTWARTEGDTLYLWVHERNGRAVAAYRSRGFVETGRTLPYPLGSGVEIEMAAVLR